MIDRISAPDCILPKIEKIPEVERLFSKKGVPVYFYGQVDQPVAKIDFTWEFNPVKGSQIQALFASRLIKDGTINKNSAQINEYFERFGAFIESHSGEDEFSVTAYILVSKIRELLPFVIEIIQEANFPNEELEKLQKQTLSELSIKLKKTNFQAERKFRTALFGKDHPYADFTNDLNLKQINRSEIQAFYQDNILSKCPSVFCCGSLSESDVDFLLEQSNTLYQPKFVKTGLVSFNGSFNRIDDDWADAVQTSFKVGKEVPGRKNKDTHKMLIANEILGGYFGSRLMKNIREDKGFTYGIYSRIRHFEYGSVWSVTSDIIKEKKEEALEEIFKEMNKLCHEPVSTEELELIRNYMTGSFLSNLTSPFAVIDLFKSFELAGINYQYLYDRFDQLNAINSEELMDIYKRYFTPSDQLVVLVG